MSVNDWMLPNAPTAPDPFQIARERVAGLKPPAEAEGLLKFLGRDAGALTGAIEKYEQAQRDLDELERRQAATSLANDIDQLASAIRESAALGQRLAEINAEIEDVKTRIGPLLGAMQKNQVNENQILALVNELERLEAVENSEPRRNDPATLTQTRVAAEMAHRERADLIMRTIGSPLTPEQAADMRHLAGLWQQRRAVGVQSQSPATTREGVTKRRPMFKSLSDEQILSLAPAPRPDGTAA